MKQLNLRRYVAAAGAAVLVVTALTTPANASPTGQFKAGAPAYDTGTNDLQTVADAYRATFKDLSRDAALTAARAQAGSAKFRQGLDPNKETWAGGWFDPYTAQFHIAVTTQAAANDVAAVAAQTPKLAVKTHLATRSMRELGEMVEQIRNGTDRLAKAANGHVTIDVKTNEVVVRVPQTQFATLTAADVPHGVRVEPGTQVKEHLDACTSRTDCDNDLRAGLVLRRSGTLWCSLGFTARSGGVRFALTAGHCIGTIGETWSNGTSTIRTVGPATDFIDSGARDAGAIQVTNAFYSAQTAGRIMIGPSGFAAVTGESFNLVNDVNCLSASFTNPARAGNPCATVTEAGAGIKTRMSGYDPCGGDSGGGWYWLPGDGTRWAVALHSSSTEGCNVAGGTASASPLLFFWSGLVYETS
jgi:streptogrisin C